MSGEYQGSLFELESQVGGLSAGEGYNTVRVGRLELEGELPVQHPLVQLQLRVVRSKHYRDVPRDYNWLIP